MSSPKPASRGNVAKHANYMWAMAQMKKAHAAGFFLETIAIAESIMSDRIWSFVKGTSGGPALSKHATLGQVITFKCAFAASAPPGLYKRVSSWADERNRLLHGIVKSYAGTPPMPIDEFFTLAKRAAAEALLLVPTVDRWHKQGFRAHLARTRGA